jgi:hypothetical protein
MPLLWLPRVRLCIHCGVEVTELSTNKQHTLSLSESTGCRALETMLSFHCAMKREKYQS